MMVENFLKIVEEIEYSCLSAEQQEKMIVQIADLNRFIEAYDPTIEIVDCMRYKINIIAERGRRKGIILCDNSQLATAPSLYYNHNLLNYKDHQELEEIWLVHINTSDSNSFRSFLDFIEERSLVNIYDRIFCLNFSESRVYAIK